MAREQELSTPRRWRVRLNPGDVVMCGPPPKYIYGCYFPSSDLNVVENGHRATGEPSFEDMEWLDPEEVIPAPTGVPPASPPLTPTQPPSGEHAPPVPLDGGILSPDNPRAPKYWMNETSGVLRPAIEAYLNHQWLDLSQIAAIRAYLRQWIFSPVWDGHGGDEELARLRRRIDGIRNRTDIDKWIRDALEEGHDPL